LLKCNYPISIITQKDILFIKRMNLYLREELQSGGFLVISRRNENRYCHRVTGAHTTRRGQQGDLPKRSQRQLSQPQ
jgi:hypothetical protein